MKRLLDATAPPTRLAAFRIVVGVFVLGYLVLRSPVFLRLVDRPGDDFDPVGILSPLDGPVPDAVFHTVVAVTIAAAVASIVGWRYRPSAVVFAIGMLVIATFRGSWGQLLHFENLMVLQLVVLAASPAADAWSVDAWRSVSRGDHDRASQVDTTESVRYGFPLAIAGLVTIVTYVIAGIAKLRYGGIDWLAGDTLRNHIAYSTTRLDLIGGNRPLLGEFAVREDWALGAFAVGAVLVELCAPMVVIGTRCRDVWVASAWLMHVGILLTMSVGFPSPLFGVAFAPFYALERVVPWWRSRFTSSSALREAS